MSRKMWHPLRTLYVMSFASWAGITSPTLAVQGWMLTTRSGTRFRNRNPEWVRYLAELPEPEVIRVEAELPTGTRPEPELSIGTGTRPELPIGTMESHGWFRKRNRAGTRPEAELPTRPEPELPTGTGTGPEAELPIGTGTAGTRPTKEQRLVQYRMLADRNPTATKTQLAEMMGVSTRYLRSIMN